MKPETKTSTTYIQLLKMIARGNPSTYAFISDKPEYETMYTSASTFPEFFQNMSKTIPKEKKCQFFKGWLEAFIESYVLILHEWSIDMKDNDTLNTLMGPAQTAEAHPRLNSQHRIVVLLYKLQCT